MDNETLKTWSAATDLVAATLGDDNVTFEWPGMICIRIDNGQRMLVYGTNNETINANVNWLDGDMWQPVEDTLPDSLVTDVPSEETDPSVIASAILESVARYTAGEQ